MYYFLFFIKFQLIVYILNFNQIKLQFFLLGKKCLYSTLYWWICAFNHLFSPLYYLRHHSSSSHGIVFIASLRSSCTCSFIMRIAECYDVIFLHFFITLEIVYDHNRIKILKNYSPNILMNSCKIDAKILIVLCT